MQIHFNQIYSNMGQKENGNMKLQSWLTQNKSRKN